MVQDVLQMASDFKIYEGNGISVSILSFFLALSITGIVLKALLNFVQSNAIDTAGRTVAIADYEYYKIKNRKKTVKTTDLVVRK